ncbi:hypothetical protein ANN_06035 [Periplaneta americana]|uniref:Uncharacterized protein n=1 Tax=Periplaneta americana TaxID=6978 RepID=A0ABQ8TE78_PERAM|nr:hypothetical protein ANN_06035 [Periplaneta americana]
MKRTRKMEGKQVNARRTSGMQGEGKEYKKSKAVIFKRNKQASRLKKISKRKQVSSNKQAKASKQSQESRLKQASSRKEASNLKKAGSSKQAQGRKQASSKKRARARKLKQANKLKENLLIYQQDGAPPHFHNEVRTFLNDRLPNRWIGRAGRDGMQLSSWPPRSPDLTPSDLYLRLRWAGHVARKGESRNAYRVLVGRPEGKRPLGRPRRRWEDNIKMDLREVGYDGRDWINLAQDRDQWRAYVRAAMNLRVL